MNCEACGQSVSEEDLFCDECGARLQEPEPTVEANQSPAQRETNVEDQQSATAPLDRPGPDAVEGFETLSWSSTMLRAITDDLTLRGISWQSKNGRLEVPATAVEYLKAAIDEHPNTRSSEVHTSANDYDEPASVETTTEDGAAPEELTELEAPRDHSDLSARELAAQSELLGAQNRNEVGGAGPQKTNAAPDTPEGTRSSDVQQTQVKSQQRAKNLTIGAIAAALIVVAAVGAILVAGAGNNDSSSSERPNPPSEAAGTGNYRCDRIRSIASEFQSSGATFDDKYWLTLEAADLMPVDWQITAYALREDAELGLWVYVPDRLELFLRNSDYC